MSRIKLASVLAVSGDPRHAAVVGNQALDAAANLRSRRAMDDLRELQRFAEQHTGITEARDLCNRITEALGTR